MKATNVMEKYTKPNVVGTIISTNVFGCVRAFLTTLTQRIPFLPQQCLSLSLTIGLWSLAIYVIFNLGTIYSSKLTVATYRSWSQLTSVPANQHAVR